METVLVCILLLVVIGLLIGFHHKMSRLLTTLDESADVLRKLANILARNELSEPQKQTPPADAIEPATRVEPAPIPVAEPEIPPEIVTADKPWHSPLPETRPLPAFLLRDPEPVKPDEPAKPDDTPPPKSPEPSLGSIPPPDWVRRQSEFEERTANVLRRIWSWFVVGEEFRPKNIAPEYAIATTWLVRGGILALLTAMALFLRYSYLRNLIAPELRVAITALTGIAMAVVGSRMAHKRYHVIGIGLLGGGFGTLYFSIYSAQALYHLCGTGTAFALSVLLTAAAMTMAVGFNTMPVALLGMFGGYAAPMLFSSGTKNLTGLFAYLMLLGIGVLFCSWKRNWRQLNILSFLFTVLLCLLALGRYYKPATDFGLTITFFAGFFLLFSVQPALASLRKREKITLLELGMISANSLMFLIGGSLLVRGRYSLEAASLVPFFATAFYALLLHAGLKRKLEDRTLLHLWLTLGLFSLAAALPMALGVKSVVCAWMALSLVMKYLGAREDSNYLRTLSALLLCGAILRFLGWDLVPNYIHTNGYDASYFLTRLCSLGALTGGFWIAARIERNQEMRPLWIVLGTVSLFGYLSAELFWLLHFKLPEAVAGGLSVLWGCYALALVVAGLVKRCGGCRRAGLALFIITALKVFLFDLSRVESLYRILAFLLLGIVLLGGAFAYIRAKRFFEELETDDSAKTEN